MSTRKVFITNKSAHDFSKATRFGELRFLTSGVLSPFAVTQMHRKIEEGLADAGPEDYILITSLQVLCSVTCATFAARFGRLNLLLYKDGDYIERKLILNKEK